MSIIALIITISLRDDVVKCIPLITIPIIALLLEIYSISIILMCMADLLKIGSNIDKNDYTYMADSISYNLEKSTIDQDTLITLFNDIDKGKNPELKSVFEICLKHRELFACIKLKKPNEEQYIQKWISNYEKARAHPPSKKIRTPTIICDDTALKKLMIQSKAIKEEQYDSNYDIHRLFMQSEMIIGELLEEYIFDSTKEFGIIWCAGSIMKAVDFCNADGSLLLQIKNRYNTENSSSATVRDNTSICIWYRVGMTKSKSVKISTYNWVELNKLIRNTVEPEKRDTYRDMTEEDFEKYIEKIVSSNNRIVPINHQRKLF